MKFEIPKVKCFLLLQEYAPHEPALAGVGIHVWVDPPRSVLLEFDQLNRDYRQVLDHLAAKLGGKAARKATLVERLLNWLHVQVKHAKDEHFKSATKSYRRSLYAWYARLWSQAQDAETHWTTEELEKIDEANPSLYEWLCVSSWTLIGQHQDDVKKGYRGPSVKLPAAAAPATPS